MFSILIFSILDTKCSILIVGVVVQYTKCPVLKVCVVVVTVGVVVQYTEFLALINSGCGCSIGHGNILY